MQKGCRKVDLIRALVFRGHPSDYEMNGRMERRVCAFL